jgi:hypothetical protein
MFFFVKSFLAVIVVVVVPCGRRTLFRPFASSARLSPRVLPLNVIVLTVAVYCTDCSPISSVVLDFMCKDIAWWAFPGRDRCMAWDVHVQRVVWSLRRAVGFFCRMLYAKRVFVSPCLMLSFVVCLCGTLFHRWISGSRWSTRVWYKKNFWFFLRGTSEFFTVHTWHVVSCEELCVVKK